MTDNRLDWKNSDWANHLRCPVAKVQEYRNILDRNFLLRVDISKKDGMYHFCYYTYRINESGNRMLRLITSSVNGFYSEQAAIDYSNEQIIPRLVLNSILAKKLGIPEKAIQMLMIKDKEK